MPDPADYRLYRSQTAVMAAIRGAGKMPAMKANAPGVG